MNSALNQAARATAMASMTVGALCLALTACGASGHGYDIKGEIEEKSVERECKTSHHAMDLLAFALPTRARNRGGSGFGSGRGATGGSGSGGAKMDKKPKSPKKMDKLPVIPDGPDPVRRPGKSCRDEYELYIKNSDGIFEQSVSFQHYRECDKGDKFPQCAR